MSKPDNDRKHKRQMVVTVDAATLRTLDRIQRSIPEIESRSAALRYMARCYDMMMSRPGSEKVD